MLGSGVRPLLAAKLLVPPARPGVVVRTRLHARLQEAAATRLTTVVAPAGWGKTTALATWARDPEELRPVAWVSLDEADDEPVRFWTYALSALEAVAPRIARAPLAALGGAGFDPVGVALATLLNALTEADGEQVVLVLDDYSALGDARIHEGMEYLLSYLPPALHVVLAGRADPPLPLARMRTRGTLTELRVEDLRCTPAEGAALVAAVGHVPAGTADGLVERTEGWPAGLHLAALTLRGAADPAATAAAISGDERHILDYFTAEVIPGLDPVERDLLVRCSVLERLSGPLCDAVLGVTGSPSVLDRLDRGAVFVSSLGAGWYRCHRLFRDVLRRELDGRLPDAAPDLLARAAGWFLEQGRIEEGVAHLVAAGRDVEALELIRGSGRWFLDHGAMAALLRMGERLAPAVPDPRLYLTLAFAAGLSGQPERAVTWLTAAEPLITDDGEPLTGWRSLRAGAESTWATYGVPGDPAEALRHARRAAELEDDPTLWGYAVVRQSLAGALLGAGQVPEAVEVLREAWRLPARRALPTVLTLQGAGLLALGLVELGHLDEARRVSAEVADLAAATERSWGNGAAAAVAVLRLAEARLVAAVDPAAALPALRRAVEWAQLWGRTTVLVAGLTSLAAAQWATGDATGARTSLERAHEVVGDESVRPLAARQLDELTGRIGRRASTSARQRGALAEELTDREIAVLRALRGPLTAREIGAELRLSINTVKGYTKSLYRKLGVDSRAEAVHRAHDLGLI